MIHNGIISNADELKVKHNKLGYQYTTEIKKQWITRILTYEQEMFNDSESLAIELARTLEGKQEKSEAEGSIAFVVLQVEKQSNRALAIHYGRNGMSPLVLDNSKDYIAITSEGQGTSVKTNILYTLTLADHSIAEKSMQLGQAEDYRQSYDWSDWSSNKRIGFQTDYDDKLEELEMEKLALEDDLRIAIDLGEDEEEKKIEKQIKEVDYQLNKMEYDYF